MSWLYTGTFGSFIGLAVGFPMLLDTRSFQPTDALQVRVDPPVGGGAGRGRSAGGSPIAWAVR